MHESTGEVAGNLGFIAISIKMAHNSLSLFHPIVFQIKISNGLDEDKQTETHSRQDIQYVFLVSQRGVQEIGIQPVLGWFKDLQFEHGSRFISETSWPGLVNGQECISKIKLVHQL